ncbi:Meckel syndrome type 1 protein [Orchesella cincta]|uniref:Meckel syndrome type 1 protein n=1 Tax=Orchesella cincta TaxID=48709 RepID=A0A1D2N6P8_ORCCI|nr:Meckel syndrome type 1 protein [Orchesella cincta]
MRRFFGRSSSRKEGDDNKEEENAEEIPSEETEKLETHSKEKKGRKQVVSTESLEHEIKNFGEGDAGKDDKSRRGEDDRKISTALRNGRTDRRSKVNESAESEEEIENEPSRPSKGQGVSTVASDSDTINSPEAVRKKEKVPRQVVSNQRKEKVRAKEKVVKKGKSQAKRQPEILEELGADPRNESEEEVTKFINKKDLQHLPRVEPGKGGNFFATAYNYYDKPVGHLKVRARLLKYPTFSNQNGWPGDFAVIDDRTFGWQEKVFSKSEVKRYQKLENCTTEQEKRYQEEINHPDALGNFLYSYVTSDSYVLKKKLKTLIRRCPVRKEKSVSRLPMDFKLTNSDGESTDIDLENEMIDDDLTSEDTIDFDEPMSSSTPKSKRKQADRAEKMIKMEKKERERKEKEVQDLEKRNRKLQEAKEKKTKDDERKRNAEAMKAAEKKTKRVEEGQEKENERKEQYMKKYNYSKRPSLPLGARMRSVQMSPSPRKLGKKSSARRDSQFSPGHREDKTSLDSKNGDSPALKFKTKRKIGHEYSSGSGDVERYSFYHGRAQPYGKGIIRTQRGPKGHRKFKDRLSYHDGQTMFIMASIPYVSRKRREIIVCMIQNVPHLGTLIFKPSMGYRNIEAKRNHVFMITSELDSTETTQQKEFGVRIAKGEMAGLDYAKQKSAIVEELGGCFDVVPNNELRLTVMGEIMSAEGFESSPISIYYLVEIPKGWRNDSIHSNIEGITHTCFTNGDSIANFSHEFSFQLAFSMDSIEESDCFPTPVIVLMVVSMNHPSPRILYEGYGYVNVPMIPGRHSVQVRTWKPRPRTALEKMRETFLDITPSLHDMKFAHVSNSQFEDNRKANLVGLQTTPSGSVKLRLHTIHQTPRVFKEQERKLDLLEKMSSATIIRSVHAVIDAFQRARTKALKLKTQYD